MHSVGVNTAEMRTIKRILSAILHLGNLTFKDNGEGHISTVNGDKSRQHMEWACELLGIDKVRIWSQAILICKALQRQHYFSIFCAFSCPVLHVKRIGSGSVRALDVQLENRNNGCSSPALRGQSLVFCTCLLPCISQLLVRISGVPQADTCRDTIAKLLYSKMFEWLVSRINSGLFTKSASCTINILDIFGFEDFAHNTFEQVFCNICVLQFCIA